MADVLIRGMEMPMSCFDCPIFDDFCQERCGVTGTMVYGEIDPQRETLPDCPLVPLPEGHGDLIDKAEAYDRIAEQEGGNYIDMDSVGLGLEECQIIVPAERCGEADKKTNCSDCGNRNTPVCKYCEHDAEGGGEDG